MVALGMGKGEGKASLGRRESLGINHHSFRLTGGSPNAEIPPEMRVLKKKSAVFFGASDLPTYLA